MSLQRGSSRTGCGREDRHAGGEDGDQKSYLKECLAAGREVNPKTLILRGTRNVAVVDASLIPTFRRPIRSARWS